MWRKLCCSTPFGPRTYIMPSGEGKKREKYSLFRVTATNTDSINPIWIEKHKIEYHSWPLRITITVNRMLLMRNVAASQRLSILTMSIFMTSTFCLSQIWNSSIFFLWTKCWSKVRGWCLSSHGTVLYCWDFEDPAKSPALPTKVCPFFRLVEGVAGSWVEVALTRASRRLRGRFRTTGAPLGVPLLDVGVEMKGRGMRE
jgi:hypothetical protein